MDFLRKVFNHFSNSFHGDFFSEFAPEIPTGIPQRSFQESFRTSARNSPEIRSVVLHEVPQINPLKFATEILSGITPGVHIVTPPNSSRKFSQERSGGDEVMQEYF